MDFNIREKSDEKEYMLYSQVDLARLMRMRLVLPLVFHLAQTTGLLVPSQYDEAF